MRVLITGGAGFVGSHLADELPRAAHRVRTLGLGDPREGRRADDGVEAAASDRASRRLPT